MKKAVIVILAIILITEIAIAFVILPRKGNNRQTPDKEQSEQVAGEQSEQVTDEQSEQATDDQSEQVTDEQPEQVTDEQPDQSGKKSPSPVSTELPSTSSVYTPDTEAIVTDEETGITYVNNILVLFFEPGTPDEEVKRVIASVNGSIVGGIPIIDQYQVKIAPHSLAELKQLCEELNKEACLVEAVYDPVIRTTTNSLPNDPWDPKQKIAWTEENPDGSNWGLEAIEVPSAWELGDHFQNAKIGIVDSGFANKHKDLEGNIVWTSRDSSPTDHGTHVAGIIGAEANNGEGISGIVWDCDLYLYSWKFSDPASYSPTPDDYNETGPANAVLSGPEIVVQQIWENYKKQGWTKEPKIIINCSYGADLGTVRDIDWNELNICAHIASLHLYSLLARGYDFVLVAAAGNGTATDHMSIDTIFASYFAAINEDNCVTGPEVSYEDIVNRIIVVGAAREEGDNSYMQCKFSNAGERVDICAPGEAIYSTVTEGHGSYSYKDGTSMAAPMVTGVAALAWSANDQLSGAQIKKLICDPRNTKHEVRDNPDPLHSFEFTYRLVNACLSVNAAIHYTDHPGLVAASEDWYYAIKYFPDPAFSQIIRYSKDGTVSEKLAILDAGTGENAGELQYYDGKLFVAGGAGMHIYNEKNGSVSNIKMNMNQPKEGLDLGAGPSPGTWQISNNRLYHLYLDQSDRYFLHCTDLQGNKIDYDLALHNSPAYAEWDPGFLIEGDYIYYTEFLPEGEHGWENGSERIWKAALDGSEEEIIYTGRKGYSVILQDINMDYIAISEYSSRTPSNKLILLPLHEENTEPVFASDDMSFSNVNAFFHENTLVYSGMGYSEHGLYRYDITSGQTEKLSDQIDRLISVVDDYCYCGMGNPEKGWDSIFYPLK